MTDLELREAALKAAGAAVGQSRPYEDDIVVAVDAVLAVLRASSRPAPEIGCDVVEAAFLASEDACRKEQRAHTKLSLQRTIRLTLEVSSPIIAAAASPNAGRVSAADLEWAARAGWQRGRALLRWEDQPNGFRATLIKDQRAALESLGLAVEGDAP